MRVSGCKPEMLCANRSLFWDEVYDKSAAVSADSPASKRCLTAPFVRCMEGRPGDEAWTPLWNLHVNGHLRDCTHICWSPMLYQAFFHNLNQVWAA